jgi:site-specific DNA recombinase
VWIGERVRDSRHYLISRGNWPGGRPPYGYRWLKDESKWEVIPAEADIVRHIFHLYVEEKEGIERVAKILNRAMMKQKGAACLISGPIGWKRLFGQGYGMS